MRWGMTLHDRIMGLKLSAETNDFDTGYNYGIDDAAEEAKEADELIAEMAEAIIKYADAATESQARQASDNLLKISIKIKEQNNE